MHFTPVVGTALCQLLSKTKTLKKLVIFHCVCDADVAKPIGEVSSVSFLSLRDSHHDRHNALQHIKNSSSLKTVVLNE